MRTNVDFAPLFRATVGFDRVVHLIDSVANDIGTGYPPYNIEKIGESSYRITLAVAGFTDQDLEIVQQENRPLVSGKMDDRKDDDGKYLYRGITAGAFQRSFELADYVRVTGASLEQGILNIDLRREVPEEMRPRRIPIGGKARPTLQAAE